jgi:hypothetical protein
LELLLLQNLPLLQLLALVLVPSVQLLLLHL